MIGTRPNVTPPFVAFSEAVGPNELQDTEVGDILEDILDDRDEFSALREIAEAEEHEVRMLQFIVKKVSCHCNLTKITFQNIASKHKEDFYDLDTAHLTGKESTKGPVSKKRKVSTFRSAMGAFGEIIGARMDCQTQIDKDKLEFEARKHEDEKLASDKKIEVERYKVGLQLI